MPSSPLIFDRNLLERRWRRASGGFTRHDFLLTLMLERLAERLDEIRRAFPLTVLLGCPVDEAAQALSAHPGIGRLIHAHPFGGAVAADEEALPFAENSVDLVVSLGTLHWVNDLPGTLVQIRRALKPDGLLLAVFPGGQTLFELREAFLQAEADTGLSPHVSPFVDVRDAGALLQRAGFALPLADSERLNVTYADVFSLMRELRGMGQGNALVSRSRRPLTRGALLAMAEAYTKRFADAEGRLPATFELITLTGWKPADSQPKPAKLGSGKGLIGTLSSPPRAGI